MQNPSAAEGRAAAGPALIIGHTTDVSTTLWVRGTEIHRWAEFMVKGGPATSPPVELRRDRDYTTAVTIRGLLQATRYEVVARFAARATGFGGTAVEQRHGALETFPTPGTRADFSFLLGSCHLSVARLTALRELVAAYLGTSAMRRSLERPVDGWYWPRWRWVRTPLRRAGRVVARGLLGGVGKATRFQLAAPEFPSPFKALCAEVSPGESGVRPAAFMIHAGDQIYFDLDLPPRDATVEEYRRAYRQAWFEDTDARQFLASCPQYMILDDHEIVDGFDNIGDPHQLAAALEAYRQYVHARHPPPHGSAPDGPLYYSFQYGEAFFFVLDTRTERNADEGKMIGRDQLRALLAWLEQHRSQLTFVVSSVPFVAEMPQPKSGKDERNDKWCGDRYRAQRGDIIDAISALEVKRLVFLVGDMHCAYHATMRVGASDKRVTIHELAGGPINQVEFVTRNAFSDHHRHATPKGVPCATVLYSFQSGAPSVTRITVAPGSSPMLRWEIVRTDAQATTDGRDAPSRLCGRIGFG